MHQGTPQAAGHVVKFDTVFVEVLLYPPFNHASADNFCRNLLTADFVCKGEEEVKFTSQGYVFIGDDQDASRTHVADRPRADFFLALSGSSGELVCDRKIYGYPEMFPTLETEDFPGTVKDHL